MPSAPPRFDPFKGRVVAGRVCSTPGCTTLTEKGRCPQCRAKVGRQVGSRSSTRDGYGYRWQCFIDQFRIMLIHQGIVPACGAALPDGPAPAHSQCKAQGRLEMLSLQLDHSPPLTAEERQDWLKVCDPQRVIFYCRSCHSRKTNRERRAAR